MVMNTKVDHLESAGKRVGWRQILDAMRQHPELPDQNRHVAQNVV